MKSKIILNRKKLIKEIKKLKNKGKKIVFTNGCFDIIHAGHIKLLNAAKKLGDVLVLALNSDSSVKRLKGEKRPIVPQSERAEIMAALSMVDIVTVFYEDDPYNIIKDLKPDVLVKGGDWPIDKIIGADIVKSYGGKVKNIKYIEGQSTTNIINKILNDYKNFC
ncbi:MAG: D-glycero-beta-D-manno-heptose 1-phosphate adenylyltransferase [Candidatus Goldbacteria bacterium]|nr:D-glycero-beta-D-manno-heptose 1-phosphate adenylyltransferase [Candidatus Goldiibacteriota bacterium]